MTGRNGLTPEERAAATERAQAMVRMLENRMTLQQIGDHYGISREAVRQYINKYSMKSATKIIVEARAREKVRLAEEKVKLREKALAWSQANVGVSTEEAAKLFGVGRDEIHEALGARKWTHYPAKSHSRPQWSDAELLDYVRDFYVETGSTIGDEFEEWSVARGGPVALTVIHRFDRWNSALALAGVDGVAPLKHRTVYSDADLWAVVVEFLSSEPKRYSFNYMEEWLRAIPGAPSAALIRVRLGKWNPLRDRALRAIHGDPDLEPEWVDEVTRRRDWETFLNDDPLVHIREAIADLGPYLTQNVYARWSEENKRPSLQSVLRRGQKPWTEMLAEAGGQPWVGGPVVDDDTVVQTVQKFFAEHPNGTSFDYKLWRQRQDGDLLSLSRITYRLGGSWADIKKRYGAGKASS